MRYFNKLFLFFYTKYYNNLKYNHKLLFFLKIFFERITKTNASFTVLGNTYRNSKWTNLAIQNIKLNHIFDLKVIILFILAFLSLLFFFNRNLIFSQNSFYTTYSLIFLHFQDLFSYSWILVASYFYFLYFKVISFIIFILNNFYSNLFKLNFSNYTSIINNKQNINNYDHNINNNSKLTTLNSSNTKISKTYLKLLYDINLINLNFKYIAPSKLNTENLLLSSTNDLSFMSLMHKKMYLNSPLTINYNLPPALGIFILSNTNNNFGLPTKTLVSNLDNFYESNPNSAYSSIIDIKSNKTNCQITLLNSVFPLINFLNQYNNHKNISLNLYFTKNITSNLNSSKQTRWLTKVSWLSNNVFKHLRTATHIKKVYGNSFNNPNLSNMHLWGSTYLNEYNNANQFFSYKQDVNYLHNFISKSYSLYNNKLSNLNFFEISNFFLLKRFYYLNFSKINFLSQYSYKNKDNVSNIFKYDQDMNYTLIKSFYINNFTLPLSFSHNNLLNFFNNFKNINSSTNGFSYTFNEKNLLTLSNLNFLHSFFSSFSLKKNTLVFYSNLFL